MKKIALFIISTLLLIIFFTGCKPAPPSDPNTVSVYLLKRDSYMLNYIEEYNRKSQTIKVEPVVFEQKDYETMYKKLSYKTISGKGTDLFIIDSQFFYNMDFRKMVDQECFADIDEIMDETQFNHDEYNKKAFDAGIMDGKRLIVPYGYQIPFIMTTKQAFEGLCEVPESLSYEGIMKLELDFLLQKQLPAVSIGRASEMAAIEQINHFIDNGSMDKEKLSQAYNHAFTLSKLGYDNINNEYSYDGIISANKAFDIDPFISYMHGEGFDIFESVCRDYYEAKYEYENDLVIVPINENKTANIYRGFAINNNSTKKKQAFDFISYMISYKQQTRQYPSPYPCPYIPVNLKSYEYKKFVFLNSPYNYRGNATIEIPDVLKNTLVNLIESYDNYDFINKHNYVYRVLEKSLSKYDNMKDINIDKLIDDIIRDIEFYYSE